MIFLPKHIGEIIGFFQAFVSEPEDVESGLVAIDKVCIILRGEKVRVPFVAPSADNALQTACRRPHRVNRLASNRETAFYLIGIRLNANRILSNMGSREA